MLLCLVGAVFFLRDEAFSKIVQKLIPEKVLLESSRHGFVCYVLIDRFVHHRRNLVGKKQPEPLQCFR